MTKEHARKLRDLIVRASASLTDEDALNGIELYPIWKPNTKYELGDRRREDGILYKCIQPHTSQEDWKPSQTKALWVVVSLEEFPEWVQPTGAHDAYMMGFKVSHKGDHWSSDFDNNVYEPGVYGWTKL